MSSSEIPHETFGAARQFATTSWSLVSQAADAKSDSTVAVAMETLCRAYWYPLYAFVRRKGYSAEQAEDLTQGFFAQMLEGKLLGKADAGRGRFRTFLLTSLQNYLANQFRSETALKRGGGHRHLSLDYQLADRRYCAETSEPSCETDPLQSFESQWAMNLLQLALESVRSQYQEQGKLAVFEALCPMLTPGQDSSLAEVAERLGMQAGAAKVALHRLRERYGQQIRLQIARTVDDPAQVDDELRELFQAFSKKRL